MQGEWFYGVAANRLGPVSATVLQQMAQSGQINPLTNVWSEGMPQWVPAGTLPLLYPPGTMQRFAPPASDGGALNLLLPMGPQSGFAIAAGYLGLFGLFLAPLSILAIIFGVLALRDLKSHPEKRGKGRAITGIVLGALVIVGITAVLLLVKK